MKKRTKKTLSVAGTLALRLLGATVLCAILFISMNLVATAFFSEQIGYQIYQLNEKDEYKPMGEPYYYEPSEEPVDAEDLDLTDDQTIITLREVPQTTQVVIDIITQVMLLILLGIFPYHILWDFGNRDDTNVRYRGQRPDKLRGLKIGLLAVVPFVIVWVCLFVTQFITNPGILADIFRLSHAAWWPLIDLVTLEGKSFVWWRLLILLPTYLFVPAIASIAYSLGGRQFSIAEFITFKKKKEDEEI